MYREGRRQPQYTGGGYYGGDLRYQQHGAPEKDPSLTPDPALTPAPVLDPDGEEWQVIARRIFEAAQRARCNDQDSARTTRPGSIEPTPIADSVTAVDEPRPVKS